MAAIACLPVVEMMRNSSSSASTPAAIAPPSTSVSGGSGTSVVTIRAVTSSSVSSRPANSRHLAACMASSAVFSPGSLLMLAASARTSLGPAESRDNRASKRSKSNIPLKARRISSRRTRSPCASATAS